MYNASIEGLTPRKKIRIREYPESDDKKFYLEIKHSSVEGRFKTRIIIPLKQFKEFEISCSCLNTAKKEKNTINKITSKPEFLKKNFLFLFLNI